MSRIIVKNLPKNIKEERVRKIFGALGPITDCSLKFTKDGVFRRFAFIGYSSEKEAQDAIEHFNQSFIDTAKLQVQLARELGDDSLPRAWSKYAKSSSAYKRQMQKSEPCASDDIDSKSSGKEETGRKKESKHRQIDELLADVKDDPDFQEFLEVNKAKSSKDLWGNDDLSSISKEETMEEPVNESQKKQDGKKKLEKKARKTDKEKEDGAVIHEAETVKKDKKKSKEEKLQESTVSSLSDMEYLKSKMTKTEVFSDSESDSDSDSGNESLEYEQKASDSETDQSDKDAEMPKSSTSSEKPSTCEQRYLVKMKGVPSNSKQDNIKEFFKPIQVKSIKIPQMSKGSKVQRIVTVEFATKNDQELALRRSKNFIGPKRIFLHKVTEEVSHKATQRPKAWELKKGSEQEEESIGDSGRLYVRNLAYCCKEEDLESLFAKYGPLSEVHLPIDTFTKKIKGFAFVSYMFPEHALQAFTELDGKSWKGRLMHILPSKAKKEETVGDANASYKQKKEAEKKASAGSSHNWNTLFLGSNAVVDTMATQYGADKSHILGVDGSKESIGVRLALGETQVVAETRDFLIESGVVLDAFSQPGAERSKTVILVKNLPAKTKAETLREMFSRHGTLGRVVLPPSGLSAIVEFMEPTEAKAAFRSLAYTKFQHVPLYLEWAPTGVFASPPKPPPEEKSKDEDETTESSEEKDKDEGKDEHDHSDSEATPPGCTLFIKNLNFDTGEEALKELFAKCGKVKSASIAKKKDMKHPGQMLSMGYGFVEFAKVKTAQKALKTLQHCKLDGHQLELKVSHRATAEQQKGQKKSESTKHKVSTKILVRNLPFEAKQAEIQELFGVFGELKTVRLPKKLSGKGHHRGFGFVDFMSKEDAKRAFNALCHSTHLYGRRLVLEWAAPEESLDELRLRTASRFSHAEASPSKKLKKTTLLNELKLTDVD